MLVDIFARRYEDAKLWDAFEERDQRLLVQMSRILSEDILPFPTGMKPDSEQGKFWSGVHSRISRELGLTELHPRWLFYTTKFKGNDVKQSVEYSALERCEKWLIASPGKDPDRHIKERLSLVELAFRDRESAVAAMNAAPILNPDAKPLPMGISRLPAPRDFGEQMRQMRAGVTDGFQKAVEELNVRFRQARYPLHYHNGFIQVATDELVQEAIETPFWSLVADPVWKNVDTDMKEALDRRDSDGRDPAWYAARALESAIKIICDKKSWVTGNEKGAHNFIDHLAAKSNKYIDRWEAESLKVFFTDVRNPLGHGPGKAEMKQLTIQQTEWAIEFGMSWIKSLIRRL